MINDPLSKFARLRLVVRPQDDRPLLTLLTNPPLEEGVVDAAGRSGDRRWTPYTDGSVDERSKALDVVADLAAARMDSAAPGCEGPDAA